MPIAHFHNGFLCYFLLDASVADAIRDGLGVYNCTHMHGRLLVRLGGTGLVGEQDLERPLGHAEHLAEPEEVEAVERHTRKHTYDLVLGLDRVELVRVHEREEGVPVG